MNFSISKFLGFDDDEVVTSYRDIQQISIIEENLSLENQNKLLNEAVPAR